MTWNINTVLGLITLLALFLPIVFMIFFRISTHNSFPALLIYYIGVFSYTVLTDGYIKVDDTVTSNWGLANNLLDAPLMLTFLTYFSPSVLFTKRMKLVILSYIVLEAIIVLIVGFNMDGITIILGPGLALVFSFCLYFFIRHVKSAIINHKATGKAFIISSLLFAYGCYTMIYLLYYVFKIEPENNTNANDTFIIYFIVTIISSLLICRGIFIERKRIHKLKELKVTRKELYDVYNDTEKATPLKAALLDFDKEQWN